MQFADFCLTAYSFCGLNGRFSTDFWKESIAIRQSFCGFILYCLYRLSLRATYVWQGIKLCKPSNSSTSSNAFNSSSHAGFPECKDSKEKAEEVEEPEEEES